MVLVSLTHEFISDCDEDVLLSAIKHALSKHGNPDDFSLNAIVPVEEDDNNYFDYHMYFSKDDGCLLKDVVKVLSRDYANGTE